MCHMQLSFSMDSWPFCYSKFSQQPVVNVLSGESAVASIKLSFLMLMSVFATANNGVGKKAGTAVT